MLDHDKFLFIADPVDAYREIIIDPDFDEFARAVSAAQSEDISDLREAIQPKRREPHQPREHDTLLSAILAREAFKSSAYAISRTIWALTKLFVERSQDNSLIFHIALKNFTAATARQNWDTQKIERAANLLVFSNKASIVYHKAEFESIRLSTGKQLIYTKVIVDARPIVSSSKNQITVENAVPVTTLRITYRDGEQIQTLDLNIDPNSVTSLLNQLARVPSVTEAMFVKVQ